MRYEKEDAAWILWRTPKGAIGSTSNQLAYNVAVTVNRPKTHVDHKPGSGGGKKKGHKSQQQFQSQFGAVGPRAGGYVEEASVGGGTICSLGQEGE